MHKCLLIPDILLRIFYHALHTEHQGTSFIKHIIATTPATLVRLARTCQFFSDLALDVLWADLNSVVPLIKCLTEDLWKQDGVSLHLQRPMLPEDWSILQRYTRRVRTFEFDNGKISDEVLHFVCLLFGQKLVHIELGMERAESPQLSLLMNLGNTCPFIQTASFGLIPDSSSAVDALSGAVCCWDHLEELNCNFLNEKAICHLAGLNSLRSLTFRVPSSQMATYQGFDYPDDKPMFSNLQVLDLRFGNSLPVCATFISIIRSVPQRIHLSFNTLNPPHLCEIFYVLAEKSAEGCHLEKLTVEVSLRSDFGPSRCLEVLRPILCFRHMTDVNIDIGCSLSLHDSAILEMALAWPNIQNLNLNTRHGPGTRRMVTMKGFIQLIRLCPKLVSLGIVFDAGTAAITAERPGRGDSNRKITKLCLGNSLIKDPTTVAAILSDILPCVTAISAWLSTVHANPAADKHRKMWNSVAVQLAVFARVRDQERTFLGCQ